jgi:two-component system C4-dicarboxylate transport sensor histidine kinase DctB
LLRQVFVNLLQNALDAVEGLERRQVEIRLRRDGDAAVVEVVDSGSGFSAAVQADIFQPFVTSKPPGRGTGLGLYIARRAVEEAGGALELVSTSPAGTNMRARLPLVLANR